MSGLCRCGQARRRHDVTDACLSPADQELVRRFKAAYDLAELGPWWHEAAGVTGGSTPETIKPPTDNDQPPFTVCENHPNHPCSCTDEDRQRARAIRDALSLSQPDANDQQRS